MSITKVKEYLKGFGIDDKVMEFDVSSATVELAAAALSVEPARITKTLAFKSGESCILIAAAGDAKIDNKKFKAEFGFKAKMPDAEETLAFTGHMVGGVCSFALPEGIKSYMDISIKRFNTVFPACGSSNSAIELSPDELYRISRAEKWVDVCKDWDWE